MTLRLSPTGAVVIVIVVGVLVVFSDATVGSGGVCSRGFDIGIGGIVMVFCGGYCDGRDGEAVNSDDDDNSD